MGVRLAKKASVCLTKKENPTMVTFIVGLGWDPIDRDESARTEIVSRKKKGLLGLLGVKEQVVNIIGGANLHDIDCDAAAMLVGDSEHELVYFGRTKSSDESTRHLGDNLTGKKSDSKVIGETDDKEQIIIDTSKVHKSFNEIYIGVNIYRGRERNQHFGFVKNTYIRIMDADSSEELCRLDLNGEEYADKVSMVMGRLYREADDSWNFQAIGEGNDANNVTALFKKYTREE